MCKSEPSERLPLKKGGTRNLKTLLGSKIVRDILEILSSSSECAWLVLIHPIFALLNDLQPRHPFYKNFDWEALQTLKW